MNFIIYLKHTDIFELFEFVREKAAMIDMGAIKNFEIDFYINLLVAVIGEYALESVVLKMGT